MAKRRTCECWDSGCTGHTPLQSSEGLALACNRPGKVTLKRVDMEDWSGVRFCYECAADALDSGVFGG